MEPAGSQSFFAQPSATEGRHAQGFDNKLNALWIVALAVVILVRPRELNFLRLLPFILPLLVVAIHLAARTKAGLKSAFVPFSVVVTVAWFITTSAWSESRTLSFAESVVIAAVAAMAALIASFCSLWELVGGVMAGCFVILGASVVVALASPGYGLVSGDYQTGSLQGVMLDRNSLSFVLVLGLTATLAFEFQGKWARAKKVILVALFLGGVLWTTSSTCLILSVIAVVLAVVLAFLRRVPSSRRGWALAACALAISLVVPYISAHSDELFKLVERNSTLTGRTKIWPVVRGVISSEPWLGHGWGGVWGPTLLHLQINRSVGFEIAHSHNGYLDIQLQVGAIGLALLLLVVSLMAIRGATFFLKSDSSLSFWPLILTVVLLLHNISEASFPQPVTLFLIFATLIVLVRKNGAAVGSVPCAQRATADVAKIQEWA